MNDLTLLMNLAKCLAHVRINECVLSLSCEHHISSVIRLKCMTLNEI